MRAHPAGPMHAGLTPAPESAGPRPGSAAELDHLAPAVWPRNAERGADGALTVAGADVRDLAREHGTPLFVLDEDDFRSRCAEFAAAFGAGSVHYAAKAFLCTEVARWVSQEGLSLDVCSGGELAVALRAQFRHHQFQQGLANAQSFEFRQQGQDDDFARVARAKAVADQLAVVVADLAGQAARAHHLGPGFGRDAHFRQAFSGNGVLPRLAAQCDKGRGVVRLGGMEGDRCWMCRHVCVHCSMVVKD